MGGSENSRLLGGCEKNRLLNGVENGPADITISTLPGTEVLCQKMKTFQETTLKKLQVSTVSSIV